MSASDADSEGEEGRFFTWTASEIRNALTPEDAELAISFYSISRSGNFEGRNILHLEQSLERYAANHDIEPETLRRRLDQINSALRETRNRRVAPLRDDKILSAWNGMMITAFAEAADLLGSEKYRQAAQKAADFLWRHNRRGPGQLWRVHLDGRSSIIGAQEDYAYLAEGLLALYDLTGDGLWLERARELVDALLERFLDSEDGGFYMNEPEAGITAMERPRDEGGDGAIPSGSSVALRVLQRLARRTGDPRYHRHTDGLIARFTPAIEQLPYNFGYMLSAIL
ncbi:MAG: AGE family epimerase/isomerase [Candidatus Thiodiazotropha sp.]